MKILIGVSHPKHVYMFKNFIYEMQNRNHIIQIILIRKDITEHLLKQLNLPYKTVGNNLPSISKKALSLPGWVYSTFKIANKFKPDIYLGQALPNLAYVSSLFKKPYIIFEDTESATVAQKMCIPFAHKIITPECYRANHGQKHIRFNGYYELAYLHPTYFKPDPSILSDLGLAAGDKYTVMRFVSWGAVHDMGHKGGFNLEQINNAIDKFGDKGQIFLTSEMPLPSELEKYRINVPLHRIHDILYYASVFLGESGTMATEAALLGTPSVRYTPFSESQELGNFLELEKKFDMLWSISDPNQVVEKALKIMDLKNHKDYEARKAQLLSEKIDVNKFMISVVEETCGTIS